MARKLFAVLIVAMILTGGMVATGAGAKDAKGCEGLADYRADMFVAGRDYLELLDDDGLGGDRDPFTYSSDDWIRFGEDALIYQQALKSIIPPPWANEWHVAVESSFGLLEQIAKSAANEGVFALLVFEKPLTDAEIARDSGLVSASKQCGDFAEFHHDWDALDGNIDGTPVATPTD